MQIKIVLRFDLTPARISVSKKIKNSGEDVDQSESSTAYGRLQTLWKLV